MEVNEILRILEEMNVAVISTADENNQPHARHIHIGVANEKGVFFMTSPKTNFYKQLQKNQKVAITAMKSEDYLIQVIRIEGVVKEIGRERLEEVLKDKFTLTKKTLLAYKYSTYMTVKDSTIALHKATNTCLIFTNKNRKRIL